MQGVGCKCMLYMLVPYKPAILNHLLSACPMENNKPTYSLLYAAYLPIVSLHTYLICYAYVPNSLSFAYT